MSKRSREVGSGSPPVKQQKSTVRKSMTVYRAGRSSTNDGFPTMFRPQVGAMGADSKRGLCALILAAIATLVAANSAPMDAVVRALQSEPAMAAAAVPHDGSSDAADFLPIFGPEAVAACNVRCALATTYGSATCEQTCKKLSLVEYPQQLELSMSRIEADAKSITQSCGRMTLTNEEFKRSSEWRKSANSAISALKSANKSSLREDFANARRYYEDFQKIMSGMRRPPAAQTAERETQLTEKIVQASCIRANYMLTQLALVLAQQDNIEPNMRYYSELNRMLRRPVIDAENLAFKDSDSILRR